MDAVRLPTATLPVASPVREAKTHGYITDGLVFHLDGINKGAKEGMWVDLVSGVEFAPDGEVEWGRIMLQDSLRRMCRWHSHPAHLL